VGALLAVVLATGAAAAPHAATEATLRVVKLKPLTIRGTGFDSGERVTLTLSSGLTGHARVVATAKGVITVTFPRAKVTSCTTYAMRAVGASGTRATFKPVRKGSCKPTAAVTFEGGAVVITGAQFRPGEKVKVTFVANEEPHSRSVKASPKGTIHVELGSLPINDCNAYTLTIVGSLGSRVSKSQDALPC
jgi:hypothetical protein